MSRDFSMVALVVGYIEDSGRALTHLDIEPLAKEDGFEITREQINQALHNARCKGQLIVAQEIMRFGKPPLRQYAVSPRAPDPQGMRPVCSVWEYGQHGATTLAIGTNSQGAQP